MAGKGAGIPVQPAEVALEPRPIGGTSKPTRAGRRSPGRGCRARLKRARRTGLAPQGSSTHHDPPRSSTNCSHALRGCRTCAFTRDPTASTAEARFRTQQAATSCQKTSGAIACNCFPPESAGPLQTLSSRVSTFRDMSKGSSCSCTRRTAVPSLFNLLMCHINSFCTPASPRTPRTNKSVVSPTSSPSSGNWHSERASTLST